MATCNDLSVTGRACLTMINSEWAKFTKQLTVKSTFSHFQITTTVGWTFFHLEIDFELNRWILIEAKDKLNYLLAKKSHWNVTIIYCLACTVSLKNHKVTNVSNFITFDTLTVTSSAKCAKHSCDTHQFLHLKMTWNSNNNEKSNLLCIERYNASLCARCLMEENGFLRCWLFFTIQNILQISNRTGVWFGSVIRDKCGRFIALCTIRNFHWHRCIIFFFIDYKVSTR